MNPERIALLEQFIQEEPENPFNTYALAMEYYEGDPNESLKLLRALLKRNPDYLPSYFKAAHLMWEEELWEEANETFERGIQLAENQNNQKAVLELKSAYQNFQFDMD